ncbi:MAG: tetratricopeptide repeat protein [Caldilineaceae bacterium]|nr:tetratricopeptide repeat protein [Caldilineaceae bacterium]
MDGYLGEYDSGRVLVRFAQADSTTAPPEVESLVVSSPDELCATINSEIPQEIRYLALLTLGAYYAGDNNYSSARAVLERAYATPPQETDARATLLLRLGLAYQLGEDPSPAKAIGFYTELLDAAPDHLVARYNRGLAWLDRGQSGDWARAVADFDGVLARSPGFLAARVGRGVAYLYRRGPGDDAAAMQDFSYVLERDGQRTMALYNRGLLTIRTGERSFWESDLQQVIELAPEFAGGYSALCWGAVLDAEPEKALPLCDQAVALGAPEALHSRGMAHALAGQFPEAIQDLTAFLDWLEGQPASSPYRAYRGQVQTWLIALKESHNPLTPATLEALRQD